MFECSATSWLSIMDYCTIIDSLISIKPTLLLCSSMMDSIAISYIYSIGDYDGGFNLFALN